MSMDSASCWHSVPSKLPRALSLPARLPSENEAFYVRYTSNSKQIERSRSASLNYQLLKETTIKSPFVNQLAHSSRHIKRSYKNRKCLPPATNASAERLSWRPTVTSASSENVEDVTYGLCKSSLGDSWDESSTRYAEDVGCLNKNVPEDETPFPCGKVMVDSFPGTRHCSENSIVYNDLKASLTISYLHGRPFGGIWSPVFPSSEVAIEQKLPSSKRISKRKSAKGESCSMAAQAPATRMPFSLRMLKRRNQKQAKKVVDTGTQVNDKLMGISESFAKAFSSMVFIMRFLQNHTLYICQYLFCEDVQGCVNVLHRETHLSFLWLFQQVFVCNPNFMLLVMVFVTDFTVFYIGNNVAVANVIVSTPAVVFACHELKNPQGCNIMDALAKSEVNLQIPFKVPSSSSSFNIDQVRPVDVDTEDATDKGRNGFNVAGGKEANSNSGLYSESSSMYSEYNFSSPHSHQNICRTDVVEHQTGSLSDVNKMDDIEELHDVLSLWKEASDGLTSVAGQVQNIASLDLQTMQRLVAPISIQIEPDNYSCYDKTDLIYQYAIIADGRNPMLLSNYAQFLYLVRQDYNRAEFFFHRAMKVDPSDGEVISRFATFLWLVRGNRAAAERAYKAAIAADPGSCFHAGSYAHFLWHCDEEDVSYPLRPVA